jgi:hypothetical protein
MLRLAADENFNGDIVRGLRRLNPSLDLVRIQDTIMSGAADPAILEWAASEERVLLTHDLRTLLEHAFQRVESGRPMPGVFAVGDWLPIGLAIESIQLLIECSVEGEWEGQIRYLPL